MSYLDISRLPLPLRSTVESELQSGESIAWLDQPIPNRLARSTWPIVAFGIPWTAFAIFWTAGAASGTSHVPEPGVFRLFPLFGVPFILIGVAMLSTPYWVRRSATRSAYVLTNHRAILFTTGWRGAVTVRSFQPEQLTELIRKQHPDGSGNLVFTQDVRRDSDGDRHATEVGFMAVRDVKAVEEMVRALAQRKRT